MRLHRKQRAVAHPNTGGPKASALGAWDHWANITEAWGPIKPYRWRAMDTRQCRNCGGRVWRGCDGIWRHSKTGLHRCVGERGTYAEPKTRARPQTGRGHP